MPHIDLERLISAGAVDKQFRQLLLTNPLRAAEGYNNDRFHLTPEEKAVIANIHTSDYQTLIQVVANWISNKRSDRTLWIAE